MGEPQPEQQQSLELPLRVASALLEPRRSVNFSSLPPEIRQKIWSLTFVPRIICIHGHQRIASPPVERLPSGYTFPKPCDPVPISVHFSTSTVSSLDGPSPLATFTEGRPGLDSGQFIASLARKLRDNKQLEKLAQEWTHTTGPVRYWEHPVPLGPITIPSPPVALHVCTESRDVATKCYTPVFRGVDLDPARPKPGRRPFRGHIGANDMDDWNEKRMWEPRIYINFKLDILTMDSLWRPFSPIASYRRVSIKAYFSLLEHHKAHELKMAERLMIGGRPEHIQAAIKGRGLGAWTGVKELFVLIRWSVEPHDIPYTRFESKGLRSIKEIQETLEKLLESEREDWTLLEWEGPLPKVMVFDHEDWKGYDYS